MADVFISYARADRGRIEKLAAALEGNGYSVWWDRQIFGGDDFSEDIERELNAATTVIVAWSAVGSKSRWVKDEASIASDAGKMIAVSVDGESPPIGFRQYHCIDLAGWRGGVEETAFQEIARSVKVKVTGKTQPILAEESGQTEPKQWKTELWGGALAAILVLLIVGVFVFGNGNDNDPIETTVQTGISAQNEAAKQVKAREKSIAVLPFADLSEAGDQRYFAEGLAEELLNVLVRVDDLLVASRTSSFAFKDSDASPTEIGERLGVAHILEGAVRKQGAKIRVSVDLIDAKTNKHVWSEIYDHDFADIFRIQEEIAQHVVAALRSEVFKKQDALFIDAGTENAEAYRLFIQARQMLARRDMEMAAALDRIEEALVHDPEFARGWSTKAVIHYLSPYYLGHPRALAYTEARAAANKALSLDPFLAEALAVIASLDIAAGDRAAGLDKFKRSAAMDEHDTTVLQWYAEELNMMGYFKEAQATIEQALAIDEGSAILNMIAAICAFTNRDYERADDYGLRAVEAGGVGGWTYRAMAHAAKGDLKTTARYMTNYERFANDEVSARPVDFETAYLGLLEGDLTPEQFYEQFPSLQERVEFNILAKMWSGRTEEMLKTLEASPANIVFWVFWSDFDKNARMHPYFKTFVRQAGLLEVWQSRGWPDRCRPLGNNQFTCE